MAKKLADEQAAAKVQAQQFAAAQASVKKIAEEKKVGLRPGLARSRCRITKGD